jgi:hypothetical protein
MVRSLLHFLISWKDIPECAGELQHCSGMYGEVLVETDSSEKSYGIF